MISDYPGDEISRQRNMALLLSPTKIFSETTPLSNQSVKGNVHFDLLDMISSHEEEQYQLEKKSTNPCFLAQHSTLLRRSAIKQIQTQDPTIIQEKFTSTNLNQNQYIRKLSVMLQCLMSCLFFWRKSLFVLFFNKVWCLA